MQCLQRVQRNSELRLAATLSVIVEIAGEDEETGHFLRFSFSDDEHLHLAQSADVEHEIA